MAENTAPDPEGREPEELEPAELEAERARLAEMQDQVDRLKAQLGEGDTDPGPRVRAQRGGGWWRAPIIAITLVLLAIVAPLSIVATWAHDEIKDTNRYVSTVGPLASDPAVQKAISQRITTLILSNIDVKAVTNEAVQALDAQRNLPPRVVTGLQALSVPLANGVESFVSTRVHNVVASPQFATAWEQANRAAHAQMVAVLTGETGKAVTVAGDTVTLNLGPIVEQVKTQLVDAGFTLAQRIPPVTTQFTLVQSSDLAKAQNAFRVFSAIARALPFIALLLLGTAILVARRHRRMVVIGALVVAGSMVLLGALLNAFRAIYLDAVPASQLPADAAAAIYDQLVHFIRLALRAVLVLFLAVAIVAWVSGPEPRPVAVRRAAGRVADVVRHRSDEAGLDTGPFGRFLGKNLVTIRVGIGAIVVLVYVLAAHPTGAFTLILLGIAALVLLVVELLARTGPPAEDQVEAHQTASTPPAA